MGAWRRLQPAGGHGTLRLVQIVHKKGGDEVESRPTLSTTEAGKLLGVTDETVKRWWKLGLIEGYKTNPFPHGRLRLYQDSVEEYDRQRKSRHPSKA